MEKINEAEQIPWINLAAGCGAEKILCKIAESTFRDRLFLKNDNFLGRKQYQKNLLDHMEFFSPQEDMADTIKGLEELFPLKAPLDEGQGAESNEFENSQNVESSVYAKDECEPSQNMPVYKKAEEKISDNFRNLGESQEEFLERSQELQIFRYENQEYKVEGERKNPKIFLEIMWNPYRIPFELEIIPYKGHNIYPREKELEEVTFGKEKIVYYKFPSEEYLARGFYEILNSLELLNDLSWYKEIYDILIAESVDGRKVWDSFRRLLLEQPMPSVEKRMDTLKSYEDYWYMKKKWKSQSRREKKEYPQWNQVIQMFGQFFTPVFDGVMKDEVFIGDWMPQLGRYLD